MPQDVNLSTLCFPIWDCSVLVYCHYLAVMFVPARFFMIKCSGLYFYMLLSIFVKFMLLFSVFFLNMYVFCWGGLGGHTALMTVFKTFALPWTTQE